MVVVEEEWEVFSEEEEEEEEEEEDLIVLRGREGGSSDSGMPASIIAMRFESKVLRRVRPSSVWLGGGASKKGSTDIFGSLFS